MSTRTPTSTVSSATVRTPEDLAGVFAGCVRARGLTTDRFTAWSAWETFADFAAVRMRAAMQRYGLGMVRPKGMGLATALADGYVVRAGTLAELAQKLGLPADTLQRTVQRFNAHAATGSDPDFGRGGTTYQRALGDAAHGPNPSLGTLEQAPFYALKLYPGDIGAATGLVTDEAARVLDAQGRPIGGLYAVGNDMHSAMGGTYPGPGITIGPGLVFAHLAVQHAVARARGVQVTALAA